MAEVKNKFFKSTGYTNYANKAEEYYTHLLNNVFEVVDDIMLTDDIGITMKYPNLDMVKSFTNIDENITNISFDMIRDCIQNIFDKDQVYEDMSSKDLQNFIEQMNTDQFEKISQFFETMPKLTHTIKVTNPNTGVESEVVLEGLQSFLE